MSREHSSHCVPLVGGTVIARILDGLLPTSQQPVPRLETTGDRDVLLARGWASAIDLLACYVLIEFPLIYVFGELFPAIYGSLGGYVVPLSLVALLPLYASYSFIFEWLYGRTPGKVNRGLLVVMADGQQCTYRASALRNLCRYVDFLGLPPLTIGLVVALMTDGRRVGDYVAGTVVVRSTAPVDRDGTNTADTGPEASGHASRPADTE